MSFGIFNTIAAIFIENTLAAARVNTVMQKRQRLLDRSVFSQKAAELVQFVWGVHKVRAQAKREDSPEARMHLLNSLEPMTEEDLLDAANLQITPVFFDYLLGFREFKTILEELDISE
eukprot:CAMPEP_0176146726 /NCGR_PEP_ID=MMETSP0120_2-20121206/74777_1 /TAXON_ID=160619 /ORGANISM="Kryptoperidinium foliaceum, Strain CCMP 1326" /LENGTH=117 /DNA_ID=CAMNT_0017483287 /DNA_START=40 /DNA_END=390 /DNA_ORIENTATION=-